MSQYSPPIQDLQFAIEHLAGRHALAALPSGADLESEVVEAILSEAGRFAAEVLAPLNAPGDRGGCRLAGGAVSTPRGFAGAYGQFIDGGWNGLSAPEDSGGHELPEVVAAAVSEMWNAANLSFSLCPLLTAGAVEALRCHGSPELQARYLPKLVSGEWTGTMNLTEPQAGSDLGAVRMRAVPDGDRYRLYGQKIFITWGEHDLAENIVHMVLARLPDAPEGVKGLSLFLVPKHLPDPDGGPGERNDVRCVSLEHKLGIHASPTCAMAYGDRDGAIGYLVGEANQGLAHMFTMMNEARFKVGLQGIAQAELAYQQARTYARERVQGLPAGHRPGARVPITAHPDVRRMLLSMRARTEAMRAVAIATAASMDRARRHPDAAVREASRARAELMTPVVKGWCTEQAVEIASLGVQVHGGVGYVEETGAAQILRDARITTIYEGTTAIQANDLLGRKLRLDRGAAARALLAEIGETVSALASARDPILGLCREALAEAAAALERATGWCLDALERDPAAAYAASVPYLMLVGCVAGGWQMARAAQAAAAGGGGAPDAAKHVTARFYCEHVLPQATVLARSVMAGGDAIMALPPDQL